ncbi:MAG: MarR family transcriptional regulator [Eubacteriales bacterium]|nr:MarR family transcriptional regulator [Eubacteriales bacterium]
MDFQSLIQKFSDTTENQQKAIFNNLFITGNKLQTLFDNHIPELSLKQFMLLSLIRQSDEPLTFTQLGSLLGCSRQNIKKLALSLEKKGFASIQSSPDDPRASRICPTEKADAYFHQEFRTYQAELQYLFEVYTPAEIETFFQLLIKLHAGIENLAQKTSKKESEHE